MAYNLRNKSIREMLVDDNASDDALDRASSSEEDAATAYLYHGIPYLGKSDHVDKEADELIPEYYFRTVTESVHGTNRTITCDNWFTTIPLLDKFIKEPFNLSITGTLKKNKREIPAEMKVSSKIVPDTHFCFAPKITLLSHTPKKHKLVLLVSTYSKSTEIIDGKPEIILHYNSTKGGTDTFDQLCHAYTVSRRTNRWPMRIFFGILDQAAVNARILLKCSQVNANINKKLSAAECLHRLSRHLLIPHLQQRVNNPLVRTSIRVGIKVILNMDLPAVVTNERRRLPVQVRCSVCPRKTDKKTKMQCPSCLRPMCDNHREYLCVECAGGE